MSSVQDPDHHCNCHYILGRVHYTFQHVQSGIFAGIALVWLTLLLPMALYTPYSSGDLMNPGSRLVFFTIIALLVGWLVHVWMADWCKPWNTYKLEPGMRKDA